MKRIVLAIILGIAFPVVYLFMTGCAAVYLNFPKSLFVAQSNGEDAPGILFAPVMFPIYLDILIRQNHIPPFIFNTAWLRTSSVIIFDWILYGLLFYWILGYFPRIISKNEKPSEIPPEPPKFE